MQKVGHHLQIEAIRKTGAERDAFARSAYNRYYYGSFLMIREMLSDMNPAWSRTPHKSYPEILRASICKTFKNARTKANKNSDYELVEILNSAFRATMALAEIIEKAYAARVVADYEVGILVNFHTSERFSLNSLDITEAHGWDVRVNVLIHNIMTAWKQINV